VQFYQVPLQDFDVDSFDMPIRVGNMTINCRFNWPTEIQQLYDNGIQILNDIFQSQAFFLTQDIDNIIHIPFSFDIIRTYAAFAQTPSPDLIDQTPWPLIMKTQVQAYIANNADIQLQIAITTFLTALQTRIQDIQRLEDDLVWTLITNVNGISRQTILNPNVWLYQGFTDYRIAITTLKTRIGRNDFNECTMRLAIGNGEL